MAIKTLAEILDKLKPIHQQLIVNCIERYGIRENFHRGLLPFIKPEEAIRALKFHLEYLKEKALSEEKTGTLLGERFMRNLISMLEAHCVSKICEGEVTTIMHLSTVALQKFYRSRFGEKFSVKFRTDGERRVPDQSAIGIAELKMLGKDKWQMTCHPQLQHMFSTWLANAFNIKQEEKNG